MRIRDLSEAESLALLQRARLGRLACSRNDQPYVVPVRLYLDPGSHCLYGFSMVGQKIDWMRANPRVCVEVDEVVDKDHWATVVIFGTYEELDDSPNDNAGRERAHALFESIPDWWFPAAAKTDSREPHAVVVYRIRIDRMTGRQAARARP